MSFRSLRDVFVPAATGVVLWAAATVLPFTIVNSLPPASVEREVLYYRAGTIGTFFGSLGGFCGGVFAGLALRRRAKGELPAPTSRAQVVERYLQEQLYGRVPLINWQLHVTQEGSLFHISVKHGVAQANPMSGYHDPATFPGKLHAMGCDISGVKCLGGGKVEMSSRAAYISPLLFSIQSNSLPAEARQRLAAFTLQPRDGASKPVMA